MSRSVLPDPFAGVGTYRSATRRRSRRTSEISLGGSSRALRRPQVAAGERVLVTSRRLRALAPVVTPWNRCASGPEYGGAE
jgi:hypothetical protein